jgi:hypothetical protein
MRRALFGLLLAACSVSSHGDDAALLKIVGKYRYETYQLTLPSGRTVGLEAHGARSAKSEIKADYSVVLHMHLSDGRTVVGTAKIVEIRIDGTRGYFVQKWPEMTYPVRTEIELITNGMTYINRFENREDPSRFGMTERATLTRVLLSNPALEGTPASGRP